MYIKRRIYNSAAAILLTLNLLAAQDVVDGKRLFFSGDYQDAIKKLSGKRPSIESLLWLSRATEETGDFQAAIAVFDKIADWTSFVPLLNRMGEVELKRAHYKKAKNLFKQAVTQNANFMPANYNLGKMLYEWGEFDKATDYFNRIIKAFRETPYPDAQLTYFTAKACIYLKRFNDANDLFYDAHKLDKNDWRILVDWGNLFLSKYNFADAQSTYTDALKINPNCIQAKIGIANASVQKNAGIAFKTLEGLLKKHADHKSVLLFAAQLNNLAGKTDLAVQNIESALKKYPQDLELLTVSALISLKRKKQDKFNSTAKQVFAINPQYSTFWAESGDYLAKTYLFTEAVEYYRKALEISPGNNKARGGLGTALSRLARLDEAKIELEKAFKDDAYNIWTGNLLKLFDSYAEYDTISTAHFLIRLHKNDKPVIGAYAAELAEKAYAAYKARYKFEFNFPITIEIFPKHDDFAVRCFGLPGSQVFLGICFGPLVTMNSPRARPVGSFNWQETLWHELAHVIHLTMTDNRIPRWLAEGVAVWETTRAKKSWSMNMELSIIRALRENNIIPLRELNSGFAGDPARVTFSYYQSSLMVEFIYEQFGMQALISLFDAYKNDKHTAIALKNTLDLDDEKFDSEFLTWLQKNYNYSAVHFEFAMQHGKKRPQKNKKDIAGRLAKDSTDFYALLQIGEQKLAQDDSSGIPLLQKTIMLFPEYVAYGNGYWLLANYYFKKQNYQQAAYYLQELTSYDGKNFQANSKLRLAARKLGDKTLEALAYENIMEIYPYDPLLHKNWGDILYEQKKYAAAIREYSIELALKPVDRAGTHYRLARAYFAAANPKLARRHALKSLEIAPMFLPAQEILVQSQKAPK